MNNSQFKNDLRYYDRAYKNNLTRREKKMGSWPHEPSISFTTILERNDLNNIKNKRALDIGCGDGRHIEMLRKMGYEVVGIDFSEEAIKLCKKRFNRDSKVVVKKINILQKESLRKLGQFDLILDWSVFDHVRNKDVNKYKKNLRLVIKPGSYFLISAFNENFPTFKNKNYFLKEKTYSRAFKINELQNEFNFLKKIDCIKNVLEDEIKNFCFNTVLFKKEL